MPRAPTVSCSSPCSSASSSLSRSAVQWCAVHIGGADDSACALEHISGHRLEIVGCGDCRVLPAGIGHSVRQPLHRIVDAGNVDFAVFLAANRDVMVIVEPGLVAADDAG